MHSSQPRDHFAAAAAVAVVAAAAAEDGRYVDKHCLDARC
jgi:hypothetical protein